MNKCKDCQHFKNDCGFSNVDEQLGLDGNFVVCGQFIEKEINQYSQYSHDRKADKQQQIAVFIYGNEVKK